jgi:hypothetical protein
VITPHRVGIVAEALPGQTKFGMMAAFAPCLTIVPANYRIAARRPVFKSAAEGAAMHETRLVRPARGSEWFFSYKTHGRDASKQALEQGLHVSTAYHSHQPAIRQPVLPNRPMMNMHPSCASPLN